MRKTVTSGMVSGNLMNLEFYRRTALAARKSQFMSLNRSMRATSTGSGSHFAPIIKSIMWTALSGEVRCDFSRGRHSETIELVLLSNGAFITSVSISQRVSHVIADAFKSGAHLIIRVSCYRPGLCIIMYNVVSDPLKRSPTTFCERFRFLCDDPLFRIKTDHELSHFCG
jgi:hypothetical protein